MTRHNHWDRHRNFCNHQCDKLSRQNLIELQNCQSVPNWYIIYPQLSSLFVVSADGTSFWSESQNRYPTIPNKKTSWFLEYKMSPNQTYFCFLSALSLKWRSGRKQTIPTKADDPERRKQTIFWVKAVDLVGESRPGSFAFTHRSSALGQKIVCFDFGSSALTQGSSALTLKDRPLSTKADKFKAVPLRR